MPTPLALITGFLGAGKTTFLERVIPPLGTLGLRPRVILNDFADARVDAARLAAIAALVTPISGDCVCCGSREELLDALVALPPALDAAVLVEANGATDAEELIGLLALDRRLAAFTPPTQVAVVDAGRWGRRLRHRGLEAAQVRTASHLWVNREAAVSARRRAQVEESLAAVNARAARTTPERFAEVLARLVAAVPGAPDRPAAPWDAAPARPAAHGAHEHPFAACALPFPPVVRRAALAAFVRGLPRAVVRAKGLVRFVEAPDRYYVWSAVGGEGALHLDPVPPPAVAPLALFIGAKLPVEAIRERVRAFDVTGAPRPAPPPSTAGCAPRGRRGSP